mgnify:CR=1 FL=1|jgi:hypothetical protein|tara:strand:- start:72 stop:1085 length:1014 start_codon:yes stop_codon:yes gene_type:complete
MGIFSTKNKFKMDALRIKERGSKDTPTNFSEKAVAFMKGMPGYYPKMHETDAEGNKKIHEDDITNIKVVEGEGGRKLYGEILGDKKFVGERSEDVYDALQKEIDSGFAAEKGFKGTDVKEYEKFKLEKMKGPDVEQEKIEVEKEIKDDKEGIEQKQIKDVERQKNFFEDFENTFEIDGKRGENQVLSIPVEFSGGNIDFKNPNSMRYLQGEEGQKIVRGMSDMLGNIQNVVKEKILNSMSEREKQLLSYGVGDLNSKVENALNSLFDVGPNDARAYGIANPLFAIINTYVNKPEELKKILGSLGLTQKAGTVTEQQEIVTSTPDEQGFETEWRQRRD